MEGCGVKVCPFSGSIRCQGLDWPPAGSWIQLEQFHGDIRTLASVFKHFLCYCHYFREKLMIWREWIHYVHIYWSKQRTLKLYELRIASFIFHRLLILKLFCCLQQWTWMCVGEVLQIVAKRLDFWENKKKKYRKILVGTGDTKALKEAWE